MKLVFKYFLKLLFIFNLKIGFKNKFKKTWLALNWNFSRIIYTKNSLTKSFISISNDGKYKESMMVIFNWNSILDHKWWWILIETSLRGQIMLWWYTWSIITQRLISLSKSFIDTSNDGGFKVRMMVVFNWNSNLNNNWWWILIETLLRGQIML